MKLIIEKSPIAAIKIPIIHPKMLLKREFVLSLRMLLLLAIKRMIKISGAAKIPFAAAA